MTSKAAPFLVSFSQLPAAKKPHRKWDSCDVIKVLLITWRLYQYLTCTPTIISRISKISSCLIWPVFEESIRLNRKRILFSFELGASGLSALRIGLKTENVRTNWEKVMWPDFTGFPSKSIRLLGKKASIIFSETGLNLT